MPIDSDFFQNLPLGYVRSTLDGTILEVNRAAAAIVGMEADEMVGRQVTDFYWDPADREEVLGRARAGAEVVVPVEVQLRHAGGYPVWIWAAADVRRHPDGKPSEFRVVFGESRRLSKTVARLEKGLERLRRLNELFYHASRAANEKDFLEYAQDTVREVLQVDMIAVRIDRGGDEPVLLGWPKPLAVELPAEFMEGAFAVADCGRFAGVDDTLGRFCRVLIGAGIGSLLSLRAGGHGGTSGELVEARRAPSVFLLLGTRQARLWEDEDVGFAQTVALEIAEVLERFTVTEQRTLQSGFIEGLLDLVPVGILVLDHDMVVLRTNRLGREILVGLDEHWHVNQVVPEAFMEPLLRMREGKDEAARPDFVSVGDRFFELSARRIDIGQQLEGIVVVVFDVTDRERIRRLAESQDRLASLGRFAAGIAHDFNNLLTGIVGFAQISLQEEGLTDLVRENLSVIAKQGRMAAKLVRQITDYGRQSILVKDVLDAAELVRQTAAMMSRTLPESLQMEIRVTTVPCLIHADRGRLDQVLANLILNASDAVQGRGLVRITLDIHDQFGNGRSGDSSPVGPWVCLSVEDDGPGIPPDLRTRVFEPFFTTKPLGEGTGLGLSQVYGITEQHGGRIEIDDSELGGAAVRIWLPLVHGGGVPGKVSTESSDRVELVPRGEGRRILLVEDDAAVRKAMGRMAQSLGYSVLTSGSVDEALAVLEKVNFGVDLVLSDVVMPGKDGLDLAKILMTRSPGLRCVLVTGYPVRLKTISRDIPNIVGWLEKPVDVVRLGRALAEAFEKISG